VCVCLHDGAERGRCVKSLRWTGGGGQQVINTAAPARLSRVI